MKTLGQFSTDAFRSLLSGEGISHDELLKGCLVNSPMNLESVKRLLVVEFSDHAWAPYFAKRCDGNRFVLFEPREVISAPPFWERWNGNSNDAIWAEAYASWLSDWSILTGGLLPFPVSGPDYLTSHAKPGSEEFVSIIKTWYFDWKQKVGESVAKLPPSQSVRGVV